MLDKELINKKKELEKQIEIGESQYEKFGNKMNLIRNNLNKQQEELNTINNKINNVMHDTSEGDTLLFKDKDGLMLEMVLSSNSNNRYVLVLLTDYTKYDEEMIPYYVFEFDARLPETAIDSMCERYDLDFIGVKNNSK